MTNQLKTEIEKITLEIENQRDLVQTYLSSEMDIDEMNYRDVCNWAFEDNNNKEFICQWKDYKFLLAKKQGLIQGAKMMIEEFENKLSSMEKHGVIIIDVEKVDDEMISSALNPTHEQEMKSLKRKQENEIKAVRIEERNKVCLEIKTDLKQLNNWLEKE